MSSSQYLHHHPEFAQLLGIVAEQRAIAPELVEKDYWLMHCLCLLYTSERGIKLHYAGKLIEGNFVHNYRGLD